MIVRDPGDAVAASGPVAWAVGQLEAALGTASGAARIVIGGPGAAEVRALLAQSGVALPDTPESLAVAAVEGAIVAAGSDKRGLVYAVLELADRVRCAPDGAALAALRALRPTVERPANQIRGIARLFSSEVEDRAWWYDRGFWQEYLTELATHRVNRFCLTLGLGYNFPRGVTDAYLHFAYPFLLDVPSYRVRVPGLPDDERERNLETLRFIGEEVQRRGLHFQLGLWTHAYEWVDSPHAAHTTEGLTPETHAAYCRDALRLLLRQVPTVDGLTFRVHGESGIPEGSYDFWRAVFDGVVEASLERGRPLEIDLHAKGVDQETIDLALATGLPINVSPKYWMEHMGLPYHQAAIREIERAAAPRTGHMAVSSGERRHSRYGYTDLLRESREYGVFFRIWPGTQRLLLWGDPVFGAGYGRHASFSGCLGVELCEPLTFKGRMGSGRPGGRHGYADAALVPGGGPAADWKKYRYTYRVWGRCTYNPDTDPDGWERYARQAFGAAAEDAAAGLANASRIALLFTTTYGASANCKLLWPELYTNMPITSETGHPYSDTLSPKRFGNVSPADPETFAGIDEHVAALDEGARSGKYSPLEVAAWLDRLAATAARRLDAAREKIADRSRPEFRRWEADIAIQAALGRFFAGQLRAAVGYARYARAGDAAHLREALEHYWVARAAWVEAVEAGVVYRRDLTFGPEPWQRGHWADRLPAIDADLATMEALLATPAAQPATHGAAAPSAPGADPGRGPLPWRPAHAPPAAYRRGASVMLELAVGGATVPKRVRLRYRHVNQAEQWQEAGMERSALPRGAVFHGAIPATYTDSPYPLQHHFELWDASGRAWRWPHLEPDLANQPYFLVRQVR